jgi:membrane protein required for colicin V production
MFFSDAVAAWMSDFVKADGDIIAIIAFILTFIGVMVLVRFLGRMISNLVEAICLGLIDKVGGFIFGLFKGALIVSILIMIMNVLGLSYVVDDVKKDSLLYPQVEEIANVLYKNHDVVKESIDNSIEKIEDVIETSLTK